MKFPYRKFEDNDLWKTIDTALAELEENGDFHLTTARRYVVGYLCQQLARKKHVTDNSVVKREILVHACRQLQESEVHGGGA